MCSFSRAMQTKNLFAAVDLGSNSFRLEIGRLENGHLRRVQYLKETVRQGNGLDADRNLTDEAMQRGWACLARFGERIAGFRPAHVRAVATQTLREARNRQEFLARAEQALAQAAVRDDTAADQQPVRRRAGGAATAGSGAGPGSGASRSASSASSWSRWRYRSNFRRN